MGFGGAARGRPSRVVDRGDSQFHGPKEAPEYFTRRPVYLGVSLTWLGVSSEISCEAMKLGHLHGRSCDL